LARFGLGFAIGLIPVVVWLLYAGPDHVGNVRARVDVASASTSVRSIVGRAYELAAWVFVGPASLPSLTGLFVLALAAVVILALIAMAIVRCGVPALVLAAFVLLPIPLLFLTRTTSGWAMAGPAAIVTIVASFGASRAWRTRRLSQALFLLGVLVVGAGPVLNVSVLRPVAYSSRASEAVEQAAGLLDITDGLFVAGDWTIDLIAEDAGLQPILVGDARAAAEFGAAQQVVLVLQDPGESGAAGEQGEARDLLARLGFQRASITIWIAPYDHAGLRQRLGLAAQGAQYGVETWRIS
jgi:hypothetical protein